MKHIRTITMKPESAQTNFQALVNFIVGVVDVLAAGFPVIISTVFNKTGGSVG